MVVIKKQLPQNLTNALENLQGQSGEDAKCRPTAKCTVSKKIAGCGLAQAPCLAVLSLVDHSYEYSQDFMIGVCEWSVHYDFMMQNWQYLCFRVCLKYVPMIGDTGICVVGFPYPP